MPYVPAMGVVDNRDEDRVADTDVEVFERIPWEALEGADGNRRWIAYTVAAALVIGAVGVSLGRQATPPPVPTTIAAVADGAAPVSTAPVSMVAVSTPSSPAPPATEPGSGRWAEADLMALADTPVEVTGAAVAEWFVTDHFTRDGTEERSFVEWAGVVGFDWLDLDRAEATVAVARLAAAVGGDYQRLEPEAWSVVLALDEEGWAVVDGPIAAEAGLPRVEIPASDEAGGTVERRWIDDAGLEWTVREAEGAP